MEDKIKIYLIKEYDPKVVIFGGVLTKGYLKLNFKYHEN